ncbi:hypothetical protein K7432_006148 [Basidiobolus ranarum]|uniref:Tyrosinase copper-binding domain-containing protein n=1 Tax=Basidiobolus ranarum TaxID=34480 RepID=A0ABR2W2V6_9FUNG
MIKLFLNLISLCQLGFLLFQVNGQTCTNPRVRKEIRELSTDEWKAYTDAVNKLHSGTPPTIYDRIVAVHLKYVAEAHNVPCFFPWHRKYIREFELALQSINPSITLPYWDWSLDSQAPETSMIFKPEYFGASGESECINEGPFKSWEMYVPTPHCLKRNWNKGEKISAFYPPELLSKIVTGAKSYNEFRVAIEAAPHALVHVNIGGKTGDVGTMWSPNDPLFWSHHAFVDKIWADFQLINPHLVDDYGGLGSNNASVTPEDEIAPFKATVASTFKIDDPALCYTYSNAGLIGKKPLAHPPKMDAPQAAPASKNPRATRRHIRRGNHSYSIKPQMPPAPKNATKVTRKNCYLDADDRKNMKELRIPPPVPDSWAKMNGYNVEQIRSFEKEYSRFIADINKDPNYVSPASLERHDSVVTSLIEGTLDSLGLFDGLDQVPLLNLEGPLKVVDHLVNTVTDVVDGVLSPVLGKNNRLVHNTVNDILKPIAGPNKDGKGGLLGGVLNTVGGVLSPLVGNKNPNRQSERKPLIKLGGLELL